MVPVEAGQQLSPQPSLAAASGGLLVSVVAIGRNEGERLRRCLESIFAMEREGFEIEVIYADSGSVDGSVELAREMGAATLALRPERPTAALGRNAGWREAKGQVVLFLDGDTILHPRFVADSLGEFSDPEIAVIWGHRRELHPERSLYNRVLDLDWIYLPARTPYCGGDALFRRAVLEATGGFDETLIAGEEPELCRRIGELGFFVLHVDHPMTGHDLAITRWAQYWKRSTRAGHAFAEVSERSMASGGTFWVREAEANRRRALFLIGLPAVALAGAVLWGSVLPLLAVAAFFAALALRSAWKARWKKPGDMVALLLYGVNSHLQQVPIYIGQLQYRWNRRKGRRAMLMEYKKP
jgi:cellulose synthase/poly-beta-1,6-N-acetylglucosamine synthase-like glycosyltransferase